MGAEKYVDESQEEMKEDAASDSKSIERKALRRVLLVTILLAVLNTTVVLLFTTINRENGGGAADLVGRSSERRTVRCETLHVFGSDAAFGSGASAASGAWVDRFAASLIRFGVDTRNHGAPGATPGGKQTYATRLQREYMRQRVLLLCFEHSMRAIDSSKTQPNRRRCDRAREV